MRRVKPDCDRLRVTQKTKNFTCYPDPEHPGWHRWRLNDEAFYNETVLAPLLIRVESEKSARSRIFPKPHHLNASNAIHGALMLGLMDVTLFSTYHMVCNGEAAGASTVDLSAQFIARAHPNSPLDAVVEVLRETGRLCFLRGLLMQDDTLVASYAGTIRKRTGS